MKESAVTYGNSAYCREIGVEANPQWVNALVERTTASWCAMEPVETPTLAFFGGYQGSGKTSVSRCLSELIPTRLIALDEIRQILHDRHAPFSEQFIHSVYLARNVLMEQAMSLGTHVVVDQNTPDVRLALYREMAEKHGYRTIGAYLATPIHVLERRVRERDPIAGYSTGTVEDLHATIAEKLTVDADVFDLRFDTTQFAPPDIASHIAQAMHGQGG